MSTERILKSSGISARVIFCNTVLPPSLFHQSLIESRVFTCTLSVTVLYKWTLQVIVDVVC